MKIRVAVIGCGSITEFRHAPEYYSNENVEISAFCDPLADRARYMAEKFGGKAYSDYNEVLRNNEIDAISVCTSNSTHAPITIEALKAGKHVLCEKPMAVNLDEAWNMIQTARENGKFLMIGHNQRFASAHKKAKEILLSGQMGRILTFRTCFGHAGPEYWSADKGRHTWFFKKNLAAMGSMGDLGVHKIDLIRWLIGDEIDEVYATLSVRDKRNESGELIDVDDNALCILKSSTGIAGSMTCSWTYYGQQNDSTVLYCENGVLRIFDNQDYQLIQEMRNGDRIYHKTEENQTNSSQHKSGVIDSFVDSIINATEPVISGEEGYETLNTVLACIESNEKKAPVKIRHLNK